MEVLVGALDDEAQLRGFLDTHFEIIPFDLSGAEKAIHLRRSHRLRLPDAIIWATAQVNEAILVTRTTKDFDTTTEGIRLPYVLG
jgi:predicted nucleic acid-binding protein